MTTYTHMYLCVYVHLHVCTQMHAHMIAYKVLWNPEEIMRQTLPPLAKDPAFWLLGQDICRLPGQQGAMRDRVEGLGFSGFWVSEFRGLGFSSCWA